MAVHRLNILRQSYVFLCWGKYDWENFSEGMRLIALRKKSPFRVTRWLLHKHSSLAVARWPYFQGSHNWYLGFGWALSLFRHLGFPHASGWRLVLRSALRSAYVYCKHGKIYSHVFLPNLPPRICLCQTVRRETLLCLEQQLHSLTDWKNITVKWFVLKLILNLAETHIR